MNRHLFHAIVVAVIGLLAIPALTKASPQDHWYAVTNWAGFSRPMGMALGTNGLIYIAEEGANQVHVVDVNGATVAIWPGFGCPRDVAISSNGYVYVADTSNHVIKVFDHAGNAVTNWGGFGTNDAEFNIPTTVSILRSGNIVVADGGNYRIQVFDPLGGFLRKWGEVGDFNGQFTSAWRFFIESEVGADGLIYVSEEGPGRIQVFDEDGTYVGLYTAYTNKLTDPVRPYLTRGLNDFFYRVQTRARRPLTTWYFDGIFSAYGNIHGHLQTLFKETIEVNIGGTVLNPAASHVLELPDGTLFVSHENGTVYVFKRYYRNYAYNPDVTNDVPVPVVIRAEQRPGTTWMDIDYIVYDGDDATVTVAALAFAEGGTNLDAVVRINTLMENTETNLGAGVASGVEHHLTWNVAADWSTNYANVQVEVLACDARDLMDFHFITVPSNGPDPELTINKSMISDSDLLNVWMWLIATDDPDIELVSGKIIGQAAPYAGLELASGSTTTAEGRGFLFERFGGVEASAGEQQRAIEARAVDEDDSVYWIKVTP